MRPGFRAAVIRSRGIESLRVLVVEDEIRLADNIATAFREGPGFAVDICHDGEEALLMCKTTEYDLIVLDLMIPKIHGADVLRTVRARDSVTPVLILTAISEVRSTIRLLNFGADDYMTKPFDLGELVAGTRLDSSRQGSKAGGAEFWQHHNDAGGTNDLGGGKGNRSFTHGIPGARIPDAPPCTRCIQPGIAGTPL